MKVVTTPRELLELDLWGKACDVTGMNPWAVNEGLTSLTDDIYLTSDQAKEIGLISANME